MLKKVPEKARIVGKQVYLRLPTPGDQREFVALNRASKRLHRNLVTPPTRPEQFRALLKRSQRQDMSCFLICRVDDDAIVGFIAVTQIVRAYFQSAYLGYYIGEEHSGQGYTSEAVALVLKYAFEQLRLHRLEANIQPGNDPSIAIVKRAGFVREGYSRRYLKVSGRWRDHERWAITAEDWKAQRKSRPPK